MWRGTQVLAVAQEVQLCSCTCPGQTLALPSSSSHTPHGIRQQVLGTAPEVNVQVRLPSSLPAAGTGPQVPDAAPGPGSALLPPRSLSSPPSCPRCSPCSVCTGLPATPWTHTQPHYQCLTCCAARSPHSWTADVARAGAPVGSVLCCLLRLALSVLSVLCGIKNKVYYYRRDCNKDGCVAR